MQQFYRLLLLTTVVTIYSRSPKTNILAKPRNKNLPTTTVCDLPKYQNRKVHLKCSYNGVEEYWSLGPLKSEKCTMKYLAMDSDFEENYKMPLKFKMLLTIVHNNYRKSFLEIEAIGIYETGKEGGYGHLGSNKSRFVITKI